MDRSQNAENLDYIQSAMLPFLESVGFKLNQRTFTRTCEPGLIQVISFGMGQSWSMYHGKFTVDIGVYIQEAYLALHPFIKKPPKKVTGMHCEISRRLPAFHANVEDYWWDLNPPFENTIQELIQLLQKYGLLFLDGLRSRNEIIEQWKTKGNLIGFPPRGKLSIAIIQAKLGNVSEAARLAREEYHKKESQPYSEFVLQVMNAMGLEVQ